MLLCLAFGAYILVALLSYNHLDPAWSHMGSDQQIRNFGGVAGAWLADLTLYLFGYMSLLLPIMVIYTGVLLIRNNPSEEEARTTILAVRWAGFVLTLVAGCAISSLHFDADPTRVPLDAGGILGQLAGISLSAKLGFLGATLLHLALFMAGLTLFSGISWLEVVDRTGAGTLWLATRLQQKVDLLRDRYLGAKEKQHRELEVELAREELKQRKPIRIEPVVEPDPPSERVQEEKQFPLFTPSETGDAFSLPPLSLLDDIPPSEGGFSEAALEAMSRQLEMKLQDFGVKVQVESVQPGPVVTRFEVLPAAGVKVSQVSNLSRDLARSLSVVAVRVVEVIPGKSVMGLEIPNERREMVGLSEILQSQQYDRSSSPLTLALGKDIGGKPVVADLAKMPHLLVAGTTGSGKSVAINAMLLSLLFKSRAEDVRLILVDPKMLELNIYEGIPHLLAPVVTDMNEAANALRWCVAEMERRYLLMSQLKVRNISGYNRKLDEAREAGAPLTDPTFQPDPAFPDKHAEELDNLPYIVVIVDEFADMMMQVGKKVEELIARLAQKARASGIHLLLATQRPSVDVITGLIKSNIPTRIAFQVSSKIDSRTILDQMGAEQLLGHGDMLYLRPGQNMPERVHGAFVSDQEVLRTVEALKAIAKPNYIEAVLKDNSSTLLPGEKPAAGDTDAESDPLYDEAVAIVMESRRPTISYIQRRLKIGYNRSARLIEAMEMAGLVSAVQGNGNREVLVPPSQEP